MVICHRLKIPASAPRVMLLYRYREKSECTPSNEEGSMDSR